MVISGEYKWWNRHIHIKFLQILFSKRRHDFITVYYRHNRSLALLWTFLYPQSRRRRLGDSYFLFEIEVVFRLWKSLYKQKVHTHRQPRSRIPKLFDTYSLTSLSGILIQQAFLKQCQIWKSLKLKKKFDFVFPEGQYNGKIIIFKTHNSICWKSGGSQAMVKC